MIRNDQELELVRQQLHRAEAALGSLKRDVFSQNPERFRLIAEAYVDQISDVRAVIDDYIGVSAAADMAEELVIDLKGTGVRLGETPSGFITSVLDRLRKGLQSLTEQTQEKQSALRAAGRRGKWIEAISDPPLVRVGNGSVKVVLGMPDTKNLLSQEAKRIFTEAFGLLRSGLAWATEENTGELAQTATSPTLRFSILSVVRTLIPTKDSPVEKIVFGGRLVGAGRHLVLTKLARARVAREINRVATTVGYEEIEGVMREIDLDKRSFILRDRGKGLSDVTCRYAAKLESTVTQLLDKHVTVSGKLVADRNSKKETLTVEGVRIRGQG